MAEKVEATLATLIEEHFPDLRDVEIRHNCVSSPDYPLGMELIRLQFSFGLFYPERISEIPEDALRGVASHELAHIVQFTSRWWKFLDYSLYAVMRRWHGLNEWYHKDVPLRDSHKSRNSLFDGQLDPEYRVWKERNADLIAIQRGCKQYLESYDKYCAEHSELK